MTEQRAKATMSIDGEAVAAASGDWIDVDNPANGEIIGQAPRGGAADADAALEAASRAFKIWAATPAAERAKLLMKAAAIVQERREPLATLLTAEQGKPPPDARKEIDGAAETLRFYAEEAKRIGGDIAPPNTPNARSLVIRQPIGVVVAIVPWNYPVSLLAWKIAPALAAGCTVVAKPPSETPLAVLGFVQAIVDAGLPKGALNAVTGTSDEVGRALVRSPLAQMVAFTGSTESGIDIYREAAPTLKKLNLELGGQTALVVFADSDLGRAVADGVKRSFRNAGQICNGVNRILVQNEVAEEFTDRFVQATQALRVGGGFDDPTPDLGPMLNDAGLLRVQRHVDDAVSLGASLAHGGHRLMDGPLAAGRFYPPTILTGATGEMLVMREETFGPVVGISTFTGVDEAIAAANATPFGLVTYVYTNDLNTMFRAAEGIESGTVSVNNVSPDSFFAPYGGWKQSGLGVRAFGARHGRVSAVEAHPHRAARVTAVPLLTGKTVVIASRSFASTDPEPLALLRRAGITVVQPVQPPRDDALARLLEDADGLIVGAIPLTAAHFAAAPRLRVVAMHGVGVDHIDLAAARQRGIVVTHAPGSNDASVADLTVALMLACLRRIPEGDRAVREGAWGGTAGEELTGKTIGILGWGRIGRGVARRLSGFDATILVYDPYVAPESIAAADARPMGLDDLLGAADIVTLHLPLTAETSNLLDARRLALLRASSYLINTARGGIVDEVALARQLRDGLLRGAGIDCFAVEPPVGNPLLDLPSVVISPHSGAHTREAITRMGTIATTDVIRVLQGQEPLFPVPPGAPPNTESG